MHYGPKAAFQHRVATSERTIKNGSRRKRILGLILMVAIGATGVSWYSQQRANAPDPKIVIRTDEEALKGARKFLVFARVKTDNYDLSHPGKVTKDRFKGSPCWIVSWPAKTPAEDIVVLVGEEGWFSTSETSPTGKEIEITGDLKEIYLRH
jgi:hypothetical protein